MVPQVRLLATLYALHTPCQHRLLSQLQCPPRGLGAWSRPCRCCALSGHSMKNTCAMSGQYARKPTKHTLHTTGQAAVTGAVTKKKEKHPGTPQLIALAHVHPPPTPAAVGSRVRPTHCATLYNTTVWGRQAACSPPVKPRAAALAKQTPPLHSNDTQPCRSAAACAAAALTK